jgi:hypothetical protein
MAEKKVSVEKRRIDLAEDSISQICDLLSSAMLADEFDSPQVLAFVSRSYSLAQGAIVVLEEGSDEEDVQKAKIIIRNGMQ